MVKWIPATLALLCSAMLFLREEAAAHLLIPFLALLALLSAAAVCLPVNLRASWARVSMCHISLFFLVWLTSEVGISNAPAGAFFATLILSLMALVHSLLSFGYRTALYLVAALSMGLLIAFFSGGKGGSDPMIAFLREHFSLTPEQAEVAVKIIRKSIHFVFYGLLGFFASCGARRSEAERRNAFAFGISYALAHAVFDESRQHFTPGRTGAFSDVLLDLSGAVAFSLPLLLNRTKLDAKP